MNADADFTDAIYDDAVADNAITDFPTASPTTADTANVVFDDTVTDVPNAITNDTVADLTDFAPDGAVTDGTDDFIANITSRITDTNAGGKEGSPSPFIASPTRTWPLTPPHTIAGPATDCFYF